MWRVLSILVVSWGVSGLTAPSAAAQEADVETGSSLTIRTSIKATGLVSRSPDPPDLFPERTTTDSMFRVRIEPEIRPSANTTVSVAYEQRFRYRSGATGLAAFGILPSEAATPFRIRPLVWRLNETATAVWRHEIDRASVQVRVPRADITIGRQAIGWGRGVMFTAVDLFAPFSPLEADREWRAGVDAVRTDITLTERSSLDLVGAFGPSGTTRPLRRGSGYARTMDLEVVGGRRAQDSSWARRPLLPSGTPNSTPRSPSSAFLVTCSPTSSSGVEDRRRGSYPFPRSGRAFCVHRISLPRLWGRAPGRYSGTRRTPTFVERGFDPRRRADPLQTPSA